MRWRSLSDEYGIRISDLADGTSHTILCGETMDDTASSWIAGSDTNMVAIPTTPAGQQAAGNPDVREYQQSFFAFTQFTGGYYDAGGTSGITTFFSQEFGKTGKNSGSYDLDPLVGAPPSPCQLGTRTGNTKE